MSISPKKILMVHADKEERGKLAIMLARFGYEVRFSSGGANPETLCQENDLIIVDDRLPSQTGFDFILQLSDAQCEKVIYLSSCLWLEAPKEVSVLNVFEWIIKPVDSMKLAVVVCDFFISKFSNEENLIPLSC